VEEANLARVTRARRLAVCALRRASALLAVMGREIEQHDPHFEDPTLARLVETAYDSLIVVDDLVAGLESNVRAHVRLVA
jgi:hypothetical protein